MKLMYVAGTHWDREWYEPFQGFRMWLVDVIDCAMDLLERRPEFKHFHLDGQTIVLEDYLAIRPENRERLLGHLRSGRLLAGPWYNLPDEWLISGESFIRNLMRGHRVCRELGFEPMPFAYTPDQFGHIAALPMIVAGFGLRANAVLRGAHEQVHPTVFEWVGPDGSRVVTYKIPDWGAYAPVLLAVKKPIEDARAKGDERPYSELVKEFFDPYLAYETERANCPFFLFLDANDHSYADEGVLDLLAEIEKQHPELEVSFSNLAEFGEELLKQAGKVPEVHGELREPLRGIKHGYHLIPHTVSARYPLKRRNGECQALLEKWAEPMVLFEMMCADRALEHSAARHVANGPVPGFLDEAWRELLQNHPHDSICGCSIDQVHRDMMYRFDQCRLIGDKVTERAFVTVAGADNGDDALKHVVVHNPLPFERTGVFRVDLEIPKAFRPVALDGHTSIEPIHKFRLVAGDGQEVPYQRLHIERDTFSYRMGPERRANARHGHNRYELAVEMTLPPCGYTAFSVEPVEEFPRHLDGLRTTGLTAGNGLVRLAVAPDGRASLTHVPSGHTFDGLFEYEDKGDSGDGWQYGRLEDDIAYVSPGSRVTTAVEEDGPLRTTFRVERLFELPARLVAASNTRSDERVEVRVTDHLTVEKGAPYVRVRTTVRNTARDHRLRVLFPTHLDASHSFADSPFAIVERPIAIPPESAPWRERIVPEKPLTSLCGVQDGHCGLAVLAPFGPNEYAVEDRPERAIALTLFRSTFKTVHTLGEPDGELLETMTFDYLLYPFSGAFDAATALRFVAEAQTGVRRHFAKQAPAPESFVRLRENNTLMTALKPAGDGDGGVIRLWNPANEDQDETVLFKKALAYAALCNLNEEPFEDVPLGDNPGEVRVTVPAGGLTTVRFRWA